MTAMAKMPRIHSAAREEAIVVADADVEQADMDAVPESRPPSQKKKNGSKGKRNEFHSKGSLIYNPKP